MGGKTSIPMSDHIEKKIRLGMFFKLMERISVQLVSLIISILLARILSPEAYGEIAMVNIFIEICNVFVNYGFGTAVIHKKNANEKDISTCFWASLLLAVILYLVIFFLAPYISRYYEMPSLKTVIRVMGLQIFFTSINSVQVALISRKFRYKFLMITTLASTIVSGGFGIFIAYKGLGVWALVLQSTLNLVILTLILSIGLRWLPKKLFSFKALKVQFHYSWKLLIVGMIDCVYAESRNLIIAKKYSTNDLAYYNKGSQFPKLISNTVNQSLIAVLFPSMSMLQDDKEKVKHMVRNSLSVLTFAIFPLLMGLAAVGDTFIEVLLTSKWLECVPYLQILCVAYMIAPMQSVFKQSFKALDRNKVLLVVNLIEKLIGIALLVIVYNRGVLAIAWSFVIYHFIGLIFYMIVTHKLLNYKLFTQIADICSNLIPAIIMFVLVLVIGKIVMNHYVALFIQILLGIISYLSICLLLNNRSLKALILYCRKFFSERNR